jgi:hypothetical protein
MVADKWKYRGAEMSNEIRFDIVRDSITRIHGQAEYGLKELSGLHSEGASTDLGARVMNALEAIRNTAMYDVNDEYHTLLQKLGAGAINDPDAKGPPEGNARCIRDWLFDDIQKLNQLVVSVREIEHGNAADGVGFVRRPLMPLLEEVGGEMNKSYAALQDALRPLLDVKRIP